MNKNKGIYILIISVVVVLFIVFNSQGNSENIRIRVVANSNDDIDLKIKTEVYDLVIKEIKVNFTEEDIKKVLPTIKSKLHEYAIDKGVTINVDFGVTTFPPKQLNGVLVSGGDYKTLLVTIGKGEGNNYWTLLYPEYFNVTFEDIYSGEVELRWFILDIFK